MNTRFLRTTAITCMLLAAGVASANAAEKSVTLTQERLARMGYYVGPVDGVMGDITKDAVRDFQAQNGLPVTGTLTNDTYALIKDQSLAGYRGYYGANYAYNGYGYAPVAYNTNMAYGYNGYVPVAYNGGRYTAAPVGNAYWNTVRAQTLPTRYGHLAIHDDVRSGTHNYSVLLNGQSVLQANNQPLALRVSNTYRLNGEDAVIFTAYDGTGTCSYKNYLLTVRADGTYIAPQEIGNCSGEYQARIEKGQLFISFAEDRMGRYANLETWRYSADGLSRM